MDQANLDGPTPGLQPTGDGGRPQEGLGELDDGREHEGGLQKDQEAQAGETREPQRNSSC